MFTSINAACVAGVLAVVLFTMGLSLVTDEKSLIQVMPCLLSHTYNFKQHAHELFIRVDEGTSARLASLDGIRAIAFLLVTYSHWSHVSGRGRSILGLVGVNVFLSYQVS